MYTNFEKEKLGKTFQYYRHKCNIKWEDITKNSNMSKTYFSNLSNGILLDQDYKYDEFINFFNLTFSRKDNFELWLKQFVSYLIPALEQFNELQIEKLNNEYQIELNEYKERVEASFIIINSKSEYV